MTTNWIISLVTNSVAVALTGVVSYIFSKKNDKNFKWYNSIFVFLISCIIVFTAYGIVYYFFKYLPMSKIK